MTMTDRAIANDAPISGVRITERSAGHWSATVHVEALCAVCCRFALVRRVPHNDGPWYCEGCVDTRPRDEFDALYCDIGGSG